MHLKDQGLPTGVKGLILGGGYAKISRQLSENKTMLESVHDAITNGMPCHDAVILYLGTVGTEKENRMVWLAFSKERLFRRKITSAVWIFEPYSRKGWNIFTKRRTDSRT